MSKTITIRVQSPAHGTRRIETKLSESTADFLNKVQKEFGLKDTGWKVCKKRERNSSIPFNRAKKMESQNIQHGDMLFLFEEGKGGSEPVPMEASSPWGGSQSGGSTLTSSSSSSNLGLASSSAVVPLDEIDLALEKEDGKIYRKRNDQLCRHGPQGKCLHCVPLEPYDEEFLKNCNPPIKFLSFHSYLRKLKGGVDKGKFVNLENLSCKVKSGCKEHPPWPGGICTKCQPNAVTLNRQQYRHVDNINFENPKVADKFLDFWRLTGNQRIGIMYGRYEQHKEVPLGIRATVAAIYEPPQSNQKNKVELVLPDPKEEQVHSLAAKLGLLPVGWIFTDLIPDSENKGTVKNFRGNVDSHFLSAEECIMAAGFQNKHLNPCRMSPDGYFGSKFVTVIVTGGSDNHIHFEGYQVSNQCMALERDNCLLPTIDVPELGYVKESSNEQYVPDVFYKERDEYGNEVTQLARPLPVEYLLVDLPAAFPKDAAYTFNPIPELRTFPIENRESLGLEEMQDFSALSRYMEQFSPSQFLQAMSDFHLLLFLATTDLLPLREQQMDIILEAVKNKDEEKAIEFKRTEEWATVEEMMAAQSSVPMGATGGSFVGPGASPLPPIGGPSAAWTCAHCTFINSSGRPNCEMCFLPRN